MKAHFQKLYGENSMAAMDAILEEQCIPHAFEGSVESHLFKKIYSSQNIAHRHLLCAEYLGYTDEAEVLRAWLKRDNSIGVEPKKTMTASKEVEFAIEQLNRVLTDIVRDRRLARDKLNTAVERGMYTNAAQHEARMLGMMRAEEHLRDAVRNLRS